MKKSLLFIIFLTPFIHLILAEASLTGSLIKHFSSLVKFTKASPKTPEIDGNVVQFENGYLVETIVRGNNLGVEPYSLRVSQEGELFAVDSINSNIVRITPPISQCMLDGMCAPSPDRSLRARAHHMTWHTQSIQDTWSPLTICCLDSRARLVAGSFQGYAGHVDGKPSDARFNHPKGVTMDDKGNVYVADTLNLAIRKIGESGVTTIAGGKSNVAGYRDGPSQDAKFSSDFDVVYMGHTCSLLVVDRGNAAIRQISLQQEDCDYQYSSISTSDIIMVVGAVLMGYASSVLRHGFRFPKTKHTSDSEVQNIPNIENSTTLHVESVKEDPIAEWPSFGRLLTDLSKLAFEAMGNAFVSLFPLCLRWGGTKRGLTPIKDSVIMPDDQPEPPLTQRHRTPPHTEPIHVSSAPTNYTQQKPQKSKSGSLKDPSLSSAKHRSSSKRPDFSEFYASSDTPQYSQLSNSKSQKERSRQRYREKSGEIVSGATGGESKPAETKSSDCSDPKFDHFNIRSKFATDHLFRL